MLRILIVDDQKSIRESLKTILASQPDFKVVATADNGQLAIELAKKLLPDLMLVDLEMPKLDGINLTRLIHQDFPSIKIIVLSIHDHDEYIQDALQAGAMGYLLKNTPSQDLKEAIRLVDRGYTQFSPGLLNRIILPAAAKPALLTDTSKKQNNLNSSALTLSRLKLVNSLSKQPRRIRRSWKYYLSYWLAGNGIFWGVAIVYLLFKSPIYTSVWTISLVSNFPDVGSINSNRNPYYNSFFDPREDYKFLLNEPEILAIAAAQIGIDPQKFGKPKVEIVDKTSMMKISIDGNTPEAAQEKAIALQTILERKLQVLRQEKINQSNTSSVLQMVTQPSLPEKPRFSNSGLIKLLALMGSVLLTIMVAYRWASSTTKILPSANQKDFN